MIKGAVFVLMFASAAAVAQQNPVSAPVVGTVRDAAGGLRAVVGIAGNFIVSEASISKAVSAAFSATAGLVKTDSSLLVLDASGQVVNRYDAPAGPALFAFDPSGAPALAYSSGMLSRIEPGGLTAVNWTGDAVSIAMADQNSAWAVVRREAALWKIRIDLASGNVMGESLLVDVRGPVMLLAGGDLLFTRDNDVVVRDAGGVERMVPEAFDVDSFEPMGKDWIAVREAGGRLFAMRVTPRTLELYPIPEPEVTQ